VNEFEQDWSITIGEEGFTEQDRRALVGGMRDRQLSALVMYRVHRESRSLDQYRLITYRCPRRCLLLDVFRTPAGQPERV